jgi:hypothetical protein
MARPVSREFRLAARSLRSAQNRSDAWDRSSFLRSFTVGGGVSVQENVAGTDQSTGPSNLTTAPSWPGPAWRSIPPPTPAGPKTRSLPSGARSRRWLMRAWSTRSRRGGYIPRFTRARLPAVITRAGMIAASTGPAGLAARRSSGSHRTAGSSRSNRPASRSRMIAVPVKRLGDRSDRIQHARLGSPPGGQTRESDPGRPVTLNRCTVEMPVRSNCEGG